MAERQTRRRRNDEARGGICICACMCASAVLGLVQRARLIFCTHGHGTAYIIYVLDILVDHKSLSATKLKGLISYLKHVARTCMPDRIDRLARAAAVC